MINLLLKLTKIPLTVEELSKFKKILIIRLSSLGDILLTTPFIRAVKNNFPAIEIDMLLRQEYADSVKLNPNVSGKFYLTRDNKLNQQVIKKLKAQSYDLVIDLQNNLRTKKITAKLKAENVKLKKSSWKKFLLVNFKINKLSNQPQIPVRYSNVIPDLILDDKGLDLFSNKNPYETLLNQSKLIGFCPGARHFTKRWPKEYFIQLGNILQQNGFQVVLFGGKTDKELCNEIYIELPNSINLSNDDDLLQTISDMKSCDLILCNDSGLMHVASASGKKVLAIFGSTVREFGFTPYKCNNLILENNSLSCRPCSHIGKNHCPKAHFKCMLELKPELVFNKLNHFVNS